MKHTYDYVIVGGGIAGLWIAKELAVKGCHVAVVERAAKLASGATTKNEGWLHAGTYHSVAIEDESEIAAVVSNTLWSHEQIAQYAPMALACTESYALAADAHMSQRAIDRWRSSGIPYKQLSSAERQLLDDIDYARPADVFSVNDKSINSRLLCQRLVNDVVASGGDIFTNTHFVPESPTTASLVHGGDRTSVQAKTFIIAAGLGTQAAVEAITGKPFGMRYFKAHLIVLPRLARHNYFYLGPGEAGMMQHGDVTIAALNRDGVELSEPDDSIDPVVVERIFRQASVIAPHAARYHEQLLGVTCHKPDFAAEPGAIQSLDIKIFTPSAGYMCVLPGKMTNAPFLAQEVLEQLQPSNDAGKVPAMSTTTTSDADIAFRPADTFLV